MVQAQKTPLNRNIERCSADFQPGNLVGVSLKDLWKSSNINGLQAASKVFILLTTQGQLLEVLDKTITFFACLRYILF